MHGHYGPRGRSRGCVPLVHANSSTLALREERNEQHRPVPCTADSQRANVRAPAPEQVLGRLLFGCRPCRGLVGAVHFVPPAERVCLSLHALTVRNPWIAHVARNARASSLLWPWRIVKSSC